MLILNCEFPILIALSSTKSSADAYKLCTISVSKNADSRHYVQHKIALSCIIIKIKIAESCYWYMYSKYFP